MNKQADKWNLQRQPTKAERIIGICGACLATALLGLFVRTGFRPIATGEAPNGIIVFYTACVVLMPLSCWILFRLIMGSPKRLGHKSANILGATILAASLVMVVLGVLVGK